MPLKAAPGWSPRTHPSTKGNTVISNNVLFIDTKISRHPGNGLSQVLLINMRNNKQKHHCLTHGDKLTDYTDYRTAMSKSQTWVSGIHCKEEKGKEYNSCRIRYLRFHILNPHSI